MQTLPTIQPYAYLAVTIILSRTFSSHTPAGSRVGYAISSSQIIEILDSVREYNLDRMSQAAAYAALADNYIED